MAKKIEKPPARTCGECIHEFACKTWHIGTIHEMDATTCRNYETVKDSSAYLCGYIDGKRDAVRNIKPAHKWTLGEAFDYCRNHRAEDCFSTCPLCRALGCAKGFKECPETDWNLEED